jgi:hypothetical protein
MKLREAMEDVLRYQRSVVECGSSDDGCGLNHALMVHPGGKLDVYALDQSMFAPWQNKNLLMARLLFQLYEERAVAVVLVAEAWMAKTPKDFDFSTMPNSLADWPEHMRQSALICTGNAPGEVGIFASQCFSRNAQGKVEWGEVNYPDVVTNRFLFDLRGVKDARSAVKLALLKGVDGEPL